MRRRAFLAASLAILGSPRAFVPGSLAVLGVRRAAGAQPAGKVYRIGYLANRQVPQYDGAFVDGLRDLGWAEGRNIAIEYRWAKGNYDLFRVFADELVSLKVDVIVAPAVPAALAAKKATQTIPIVFPIAGAPVEVGLVRSLARPGGNITGIAVLFPELSMKRLELLRACVPRLSRVGVLWNASNPAKVADWKATQAAARELGLSLLSVEVRGADDFATALVGLGREGADALMTLDDPLTTQYAQRILDFAATKRLPTIYALRDFVDAGGLMSYSPSFREMFRRAAVYVDKILRGARPGDLPVEQPTKFELIVNLKTAKSLGLTIPPSVLLRADQVIE